MPLLNLEFPSSFLNPRNTNLTILKLLAFGDHFGVFFYGDLSFLVEVRKVDSCEFCVFVDDSFEISHSNGSVLFQDDLRETNLEKILDCLVEENATFVPELPCHTCQMFAVKLYCSLAKNPSKALSYIQFTEHECPTKQRFIQSSPTDSLCCIL
jgi:hypothetical protein